jgi:hypothetical protein
MKRTPFKKKRKTSSKAKAWTVFSQYIRQSDAKENGAVSCFSCGTVRHWKELDAGHYVAGSLSLALRFDERNVHPQCTGCNRFRHGNLTQYALRLQEKYGPQILDELERDRRNGEGFKIYESGYRELVETYEKKLGELQSASPTPKK